MFGKQRKKDKSEALRAIEELYAAVAAVQDNKRPFPASAYWPWNRGAEVARMYRALGAVIDRELGTNCAATCANSNSDEGAYETRDFRGKKPSEAAPEHSA